MRNEHTHQWAISLRGGLFEQATGVLHEVFSTDSSERHRFCCLGLGAKVAGCKMGQPTQRSAGTSVIPFLSNVPSDIGQGAHEVRSIGLPPRAFHEWLGLSLGPSVYEASVYLDAPMAVGGQRGSPSRFLGGTGLHVINDEWRLSFPQIADLIDYFGVSANPVYPESIAQSVRQS